VGVETLRETDGLDALGLFRVLAGLAPASSRDDKHTEQDQASQ
jgi:hypothetical protein